MLPKRTVRHNNKKKPGVRRNYVDCEVMNEFITRPQVIRTITSIRCVFWRKEQLYPKAWFFDGSCIMLSVIDPSAITGDIEIMRC